MSALPAAAWFPDPTNPSQLRWWDGARWSDEVLPARPADAEGETVTSRMLGVLRDESKWTSFPDAVVPVQVAGLDDAALAEHTRSERRILVILGVVGGCLLLFLGPFGLLIGFFAFLGFIAWCVATGWFAGPTAMSRAHEAWCHERGLEPMTSRVSALSSDTAAFEPSIVALRAAGYDRRLSTATGAAGRPWAAANGALLARLRFSRQKGSDSFSIISIPLPYEVAQRFPGVAIEFQFGPSLLHDRILVQDAAWTRRTFERPMDQVRVYASPEQDEIALFELLDTVTVDDLASRANILATAMFGFVVANGQLIAWNSGEIFRPAYERAMRRRSQDRIDRADAVLETWFTTVRTMHRRLLSEWQ